MDDFTDGFRAGWAEAIAEAERRCQTVWFPTGDPGWGVSQQELVLIRSLPAKAQGVDS